MVKYVWIFVLFVMESGYFVMKFLSDKKKNLLFLPIFYYFSRCLIFLGNTEHYSQLIDFWNFAKKLLLVT